MRLPVGWNEAKLGEVCEVMDVDHKMPKSQRNGVPFISAKDLLPGPRINFADTKFISEEDYLRQTKKCAPKKDDVLFSRIGTIGIARLVKEDRKFGISYSLCIVRPSERVLPEYLEALMNSEVIRRQASVGTQSIAVPDLGLTQIKNFLIPLPPKNVQQKIIQVYARVTQLRSVREQANQLADKIIQSVFLRMFGDPEENEKRWSTKRLGEMMKISGRLVKPGVEHMNMIHVGAENVEGRTGRLVNLKSIEQDGITSVNFLFSPNEVLYCKIRPNLQKVALPDFSGLCSADIYPLKAANGVSREFLWQLLRSQAFTRYSTSISASRANIPKINRDELEDYTAICPPQPLQEKFAVIVRKELNLRRLQDSGKNMMDKLFHSLTSKAFNGGLVS
jgi:type I restriction enzyme S subunit